MTDKLIVRIENGCMYYESHEGNWITDRQYDCIMDCFVENTETLTDIKNVADAIRESREQDKVFLVTILNPSVVIEKGGWSNYGWDPDYVWLDWHEDSITIEPAPEPVPQISKDQMTFADILGTG